MGLNLDKNQDYESDMDKDHTFEWYDWGNNGLSMGQTWLLMRFLLLLTQFF